MSGSFCTLPIVLVAGTAAALPPFTIEPLVMDGDVFEEVGAITAIDSLAVNDRGDWLVEADTDHPNTDADGVMILNGVVVARQGQALAAPAGATLSSFDSASLNKFGDAGWNLFLDGTAGSSDDSGLFFNTTMVFQEGTISGAAGLSKGTPYIGFFEVKLNDRNQFLVVASIDDPEIASTVDRAMMLIEYDPMTGAYTETLLAAEGTTLPGGAGPATDFGTSSTDFDFNNAGDALYTVISSADAVYLHPSGGTPQLVAIEGGESGAPGRLWSSLSSALVGMNNLGQYAIHGTVDGDTNSNTLITLDGKKYVQEGDPVPGAESFAFTSFGTVGVDVNDAGEVLYYGDWNDPDTDVDTGLFLDGVLLVQEGVTEIDGSVVDTIASTEYGFAMSPNGNYIVFEARLLDGRDGAFMIVFCAADFDRDGTLGVGDFTAFRNAYIAGNPRADFDADGSLGVSDFTAFRNAYLAGCP